MSKRQAGHHFSLIIKNLFEILKKNFKSIEIFVLQCLSIKNSGRSTQPAYIFMVITPLMAIELKATPNGNPTNNFYVRQESNFFNVVQCNTTSRPIIFHRPNLCSLTGKFKQPVYPGVRPRSYSYLADLIPTLTKLPSTAQDSSFAKFLISSAGLAQNQIFKICKIRILTNYRLLSHNGLIIVLVTKEKLCKKGKGKNVSKQFLIFP